MTCEFSYENYEELMEHQKSKFHALVLKDMSFKRGQYEKMMKFDP